MDPVEVAFQQSVPETECVLGVRIHVLRTRELVDQVARLLADGGKHLVTYVNVHTINIAGHDVRLREAYRRSAITYCDGGGVVLGARLLGKTLPERITSASFIDDYCERWRTSGTRLFFLGGEPGVAGEACRRLQERHPGLQIAGHAHGHFRRNHPEEEELFKAISGARPDILFVGMGTPEQEHWVLDNWERLDAKIIWPIGALVDYVGGKTPRAPEWMQRHSMEWLFRLGLEPRRMFVRYVVGNPRFLLRILKERISGP
jgi:N-acetylglucosaminyldiphosphoundecaprenol N-acetyl-beta-D-mannosaminyltransferase